MRVILTNLRCLGRIFSYLDVVSLCRCAQVSKAWNVLALDGSNWQRIDLFDFQRDVEVNNKKTDLRPGSHLVGRIFEPRLMRG